MDITALESKWKMDGNKLVLEIEVADFMAAVNLVNRIARIAEQLDHHPDITIHSYRQLRISVYSHDTNSVAGKDYRLAQEIEKVIP